MSAEDKKEKEPRHPEVTFLPPLQMVLSFLDRKVRRRARMEEESETSDEKTVEKLIEKLSEKDK